MLRESYKKPNTHISHQMIHEAFFLQTKRHPNIIKVYKFHNEEDFPSILFEYFSKRLDEVISTISDVDIACAIYQIAEGMKFVHFNDVVHFDLNPTCIFVENDNIIKIAGFGNSWKKSDKPFTNQEGFNLFMAPEILNKQEINEKVDVYSFGVLMFYMLNHGEMPNITIIEVGSGKKAGFPKKFTKFAKNMIDSCWNSVCDDRPSFSDICDKLINNTVKLFNFSQEEKEKVQIFIESHLKTIEEIL